jgi:DNA replication protein DnaC
MKDSLLKERLTELHLPTIRSCYPGEADAARKDALSYEAYLLRLAELECEERGRNRIERLLRESRLPLEKSFRTFDSKRLSPKLLHQVTALKEGHFLARKENILAFGNPGSGKTHLLCALAQELVYQGYRMIFYSCSLLIQELLRAKADLRLEAKLKSYSKYDAMVIDDIGYVQYSREEMELLFALLSYRYERGSLMLTSNLPFSGWESIFKDPMTTAAAIDRLVHHSVILELNLPSYRLEESKKQKA